MSLDGQIKVDELVTLAGDPHYYKAVEVYPGAVGLVRVEYGDIPTPQTDAIMGMSDEEWSDGSAADAIAALEREAYLLKSREPVSREEHEEMKRLLEEVTAANARLQERLKPHA